MKYKLLCIFLFCLKLNGLAQIIVKGKVHDATGKAIDGANIILSQKSNGVILTYGTTNKDGIFTVSYTSPTDSLIITASNIGYEKAALLLSGKDSHFLDILLKPSTNDLNEVEIKAVKNPIKARGDTINYDVKAFSDSSDRVIIDVIKKLPGITVTKSGQILYNNKAINKLYIEGKDLLDSRYNIATNNLPSNDVEQIQVLEDHQPIKILENTTPSDRAAINIRLKDNAKLRLLGNAQLGAGVPGNLRDDNLSLLKFSKGLQFINTAKTNNTGDNLDEELSQQYFSPNYYESGSSKQDLAKIAMPSKPPIDQNRYWFNNNNLGTGNYLVSLNKTLDLKLNTAIETDAVSANPSSLTNIYLPKDTIRINEGHAGKQSVTKLITGLALQANKKDFYLNNDLRYEQIWSSQSDYISNGSISQQLKNPFQSFTNNLNGFISVANNIVGFSSFTAFNNLPQNLTVSPGLYPDILNAGNPFEGLFQQIHKQTFYTNNYLTYVKKLKLINFTNSPGITVRSETLGNDLTKKISNDRMPVGSFYQDTIKRNMLRLYDELGVTVINEGFNGSLTAKISYNSLDDSALKLERSFNKLFFEPQLYFKFNLNNYFSNSITLAMNNKLDDNTSPGFILNDYRSFYVNDAPISQVNNKTLSYQLNYKNTITGIFSNLNFLYTSSRSNVMTDDQYDSTLTVRKYIAFSNQSQYLNTSLNVSKFWLSLKTTLTLHLNYALNIAEQLQQGNLLHFRNNEYTVGTKINSNPNDFITLTHNAELTVYENDSETAGLNTHYDPVYSFRQTLKATIFLPWKIQATGNIEQYINSTTGSKRTNASFVDLTLQKRLMKRKLDFGVTASNLFNTKNYIDYVYSNNILTTANYPLRGRMLMVKAMFQF
ncbi:carboxypeptidase-like regulatory domain-containing protein [Mucilaginibacter sp.]|uniref:carboxypeptidase-like regulatory domain-containing protein n=1 Tax=Mucilaginibacter sp. TaxID=1882438 RepID=UPI0025F027A2|nr:carboxypeptidase-like regulatory domain-containing protein [Mucilaginibacter sp.]